MKLADAADVYDPSIQKMFVKMSKLDPKDYKKYYNVEEGVEDYIRKDSSLTGLGEAGRIQPENAVIVGESPVQGFDKSYTQVEFGKVLAFSKRMWKFGIQKRDMTKITRELVMVCVRKRERLCAERLDNGWDTSYTHSDANGNYTVSNIGGDAVAAFTASHTREDGGTNWNNIIYDGTTYNMDCDYDAIKAAFRTASLVKDGKGNPANVNPTVFVAARGSNPYFRLQEINGALKKNELPGSADNDGAGFSSFKTLTLPYLTNLNYFYSFDESMVNESYGFQLLESESINMEGPNLVFKTGEIQYKAVVMFDLGHNDVRNWQASKGTNAA